MDSKCQDYYPLSCILGRTIPEPNLLFQASLAGSTGSTIQITQLIRIVTFSFLEKAGQGANPSPSWVGTVSYTHLTLPTKRIV